MNLLELVRDVPDHPRQGIVFKDLTPLLADAAAFRQAVDELCAPFSGVDAVLGIEARGFLLAAPMAYRLGCGVVPVRKAGKLPGAVHERAYDLEYGSSSLELHRDALASAARVLIVDDVLATGGTATAAIHLVELCGATPVGVAVLLELAALGGRAAIAAHRVHAVLSV